MPEHDADPHADPHAQPDHVVPVGTYILVFLALMVGTAVTVAASYVDLGMWNTPVAMLIAITKAGLVVSFFMHLKYSPRLYWIWLGAGVFFLVHLLVGTGADILGHIFLNLGSPGT
jgi:cytochrome c oxidase subunit 4